MSCCESDFAERTQERPRENQQERLKGKEGAAGRDVNGGNVPDLLSCGS